MSSISLTFHGTRAERLPYVKPLVACTYMVQEKPYTWRLPCFPGQSRIREGFFRAFIHRPRLRRTRFHELAALSPVDWLYLGHPDRALLDGCDSWVPQTAEFRARVLFSLPGVLSFLWWFAAGPQLGNPLPQTARRGRRLRHRYHLRGPVHVPCTAAASAYGIRGHPRFASG